MVDAPEVLGGGKDVGGDCDHLNDDASDHDAGPLVGALASGGGCGLGAADGLDDQGDEVDAHEDVRVYQ